MKKEFFEELQAEYQVVIDEMAALCGHDITKSGKSRKLNKVCKKLYKTAIQGYEGLEQFEKLLCETDDVMEKILECKGREEVLVILRVMFSDNMRELGCQLIEVCGQNRVLKRKGGYLHITLAGGKEKAKEEIKTEVGEVNGVTRVMSWAEWEKEFEPILNHIHPDQYDVFETFGKDAKYIEGCDPARVWTALSNTIDATESELEAAGYKYDEENDFWEDINGDSFDGSIITNGWHFVNRYAYYVTKKPAEPNVMYEIVLDDTYLDYLRRLSPAN